jgi:amino acid permease
MLSARKQLLANAERIAIISSGACVMIAVPCSADESFFKLGPPVVLIAFGAMFYLAFLIAGLTTELNVALGKVKSSFFLLSAIDCVGFAHAWDF